MPVFTKGEVELGLGDGDSELRLHLTSLDVKTAEFSAGSCTQRMELRYLTSLGCLQHLLRAAGQIERLICYIHLGPISRIQIHRRCWRKVIQSVRMVCFWKQIQML